MLNSQASNSSHPVWVRGLKQEIIDRQVERVLSHPVWVRGLKRGDSVEIDALAESHPVWVRGLKRLEI